MDFYLGCAVWSYKEWVGNLYPSKSNPSNFLRLYSRRFTTVEGNTTFYAVPSPETVEKWVNQTPDGFKFCPKMNRQVTHQGLLCQRIPKALSFLERMSAMGDRLGTVFIQLPPGYSPEYFDDLQEFLTACSQTGLSLALEVRHRDWFSIDGDRLNALLAQLNIARVMLDTRPIYNCPENPQATSQRQKPKLPLQPLMTNNVAFVRFISHPDPQYNQSYLQVWVDTVNNWLCQGKQVYFFVHCPKEVYSPSTAKHFSQLLIHKNSDIADLPWNSLDPEPTQLSLF